MRAALEGTEHYVYRQVDRLVLDPVPPALPAERPLTFARTAEGAYRAPDSVAEVSSWVPADLSSEDETWGVLLLEFPDYVQIGDQAWVRFPFVDAAWRVARERRDGPGGHVPTILNDSVKVAQWSAGDVDADDPGMCRFTLSAVAGPNFETSIEASMWADPTTALPSRLLIDRISKTGNISRSDISIDTTIEPTIEPPPAGQIETLPTSLRHRADRSAQAPAHHDRVVEPLDLGEPEVAIERDGVRVPCRDVEVDARCAGLPEVRRLSLHEGAPEPEPSRAVQQVDVQVGRVAVDHRVGGAGRSVDRADEFGVGGWVVRFVVRQRVRGAQRGPPGRLAPGFEGPRIDDGEAISGDAAASGHDECVIRLSDDVRADVDVPEQIRIGEPIGGVLPGVAGEQADPIGAGQVVQHGGTDAMHGHHSSASADWSSSQDVPKRPRRVRRP